MNTLLEDPSSFSYITKELQLKNSSTSIQVLLDAHLNVFSDLRVFYAISDKSNFEPIFIPFPGYDNLDPQGNIISSQNNSGRPDSRVSPSSYGSFESLDLAFKEHKFSVSNLPSFRFYRIKLVAASSNQVYVPRIRNLRTICFA